MIPLLDMVLDAFALVLNVERHKLSETSNAIELGADSFDQFEIELELEEKLEIVLPTSKSPMWRTAIELKAMLESAFEKAAWEPKQG